MRTVDQIGDQMGDCVAATRGESWNTPSGNLADTPKPTVNPSAMSLNFTEAPLHLQSPAQAKIALFRRLFPRA